MLPFANESAAEENAEFLANGIHDDILTQLAKINSLSVISRTSVEVYRDSQQLMSEIGEALNATSIVEGRVQRAGDMVRINVQLIDAATDEHLWAEIYNSELTADNIFEIQANVATSIAAALQAELSPDEIASIERVATGSTEALELYWQARALVPNISGTAPPDEFHELLDRAIELDPNFALPHALKAAIYAFLMTNVGLTPTEVMTREVLARGHAAITLDLDPLVGLAYFALGSIHRFMRRPTAALEATRRAVELSPNDLDIIEDYAILLSYAGLHEEAVTLARRSREAGRPTFTFGLLAFRAGEYEETRDYYQERAVAAPEDGDIRVRIAHAEYAMGNFQASVENLEIADELFQRASSESISTGTLARAAHAFGLVGNQVKASEYAEAVLSRGPFEGRLLVTAALAHLGEQDEESALRALREFADQRPPAFGTNEPNIADNSFLDPVLNKPEFVEIRTRLGFGSL